MFPKWVVAFCYAVTEVGNFTNPGLPVVDLAQSFLFLTSAHRGDTNTEPLKIQ